MIRDAHPMSEMHRETKPVTPLLERVIGSYSQNRPGPTVVVTAGLHGNEPAGTRALARVFATLEERQLPLRGKVLGLGGNLSALARGQRFVDRDLNRGWTHQRIAALLARSASEDAESEDADQRALLAVFRGLFAEAREPIVFLDVHSTSAGGAPFCAMSDTLRNRKIAFALPVPVILGLEETLVGTMLSYLDSLGHVSIVFEGGQNQDPTTIDHDEAAIWITLVAAGCLLPAEIPSYADRVACVEAKTRSIPHVVEICHRHHIHAGDDYVMRPDYENFNAIRKGEVLAHDRHGEVKSGFDALILMPLYQKQGDDGYFVVRPVRRFWLELSRWFRTLRVDALLSLLPGVRVHPANADALVVDRRIARYLVVEVFHLCGFRRSGESGGKLLFTRRRPDYRGVAGVDLRGDPDLTI
jgi:succinylglutamate desuccinylase